MIENFQKALLTAWKDIPAPIAGHCQHAHEETGLQMGHALWKVIPEA